MADELWHTNQTGSSVMYTNSCENASVGKAVAASGDATLKMTENIICMTLALFGLVGSIMSVIVLQKHRPKTSNTLLLQILAVSDAFLLLSSLSNNVYAIKIYFTNEPKLKHKYFLFGVVILYDIAQFTSNWILVQLALDRYIAICKPFAAVNWCTISRSWKGFILIFLGSVILTLPRALDLFVYNKVRGHNNVYIIVNIILRYYVQILILFVLNVRLILAIKHAEEKHTSLTGAGGVKASTNKGVTLNLIVVLLVFLVCGTCRGIFYILYNGFQHVFPKHMMAVFNTTSKVLMTLNSSINFLVYCMFYKRFRFTLRRMCCRGGRNHGNNARWNSSTYADSTLFS